MSVEFIVTVAGCAVRIAAIYPETMRFCRAYLTDCPSEGLPVLEVHISEEDIEYERLISTKNRGREARSEQSANPYLETLAVYRKIAEQLPGVGRILFHGSALAMDGEGYLFAAKSGTGKSTHARLWRESFGERVVMVNDDKPILSVAPEGILVWGTPWDGKHHLSRNMSVPLKALCVLGRGEENFIERLTREQAYPNLLKQIYRPQDISAMGLTLAHLDRLLETVPVYRLSCNMEPEAAIISYEGMQNR